MNVNPVKINSFTIKISKAISLVGTLTTICILLLLSPVLFGQNAFAVKQTDCTGYPVNSLAYYAYMPAEDYFPGDCAAIQTERGPKTTLKPAFGIRRRTLKSMPRCRMNI